MDDLSCLFPSRIAVGLRLRTQNFQPFVSTQTSNRPRFSAHRRAVFLANQPRDRMENRNFGKSDVANPIVVNGDLVCPVSGAVGNRTVVAIVVQPIVSRTLAIPILRPFERRLAAGTAELPALD